MIKLDVIAEELFNKIRTRFPEVTLGDSDGTVTNEPSQARFLDFKYVISDDKNLGNVSISLDEEDGMTLIFSKDIVDEAYGVAKDHWYNFLKDMRRFSKKRLMNFEVRDINRSNLTKRDYQFLAQNRPGDRAMAESRMYGTSKTSYQKIGNARLAIKHSAPINNESANGRTQKIKSIYVESPDGERFKFPYKHLSGARAMARHVSEGGTAYDEFGKHISSLSEELGKLRKFNQHLTKNSVMAETLNDYTGVVKERVEEIKKEISKLQKESYYKEALESFEPKSFSEVPKDVEETWIDQLTIKQFNEELKDIFPYVYNLIGEKYIQEVTLEDVINENNTKTHTVSRGETVYSIAKQHGVSVEDVIEVNNLDNRATIYPGQDLVIPVQIGAGATRELSPSGQPTGSTRGVNPMEEFENIMNSIVEHFVEDTVEHGQLYVKFRPKKTPGATGGMEYLTGFADFAQDPAQVKEKTALRKFTTLNSMENIANAIKKMMNDETFVSAKQIVLYRDRPGLEKKHPHLEEFYNWIETSYTGDKIKIEEPAEDLDKPEREKGAGKKRLPKGHAASGEMDVTAPEKKMTRYFSIDNDRLLDFLRKQMPDFMNKHYRANIKMFVMNDRDYRQFEKFLQSEKVVDNYGPTNIDVDQERSFSEDTHSESSDTMSSEKESKTPLGEFILSYFDRETGQFPKGPTAVLTMVEKEYGDKYVLHAKNFMEKVNDLVAKKPVYSENKSNKKTSEVGRISALAGLK